MRDNVMQEMQLLLQSDDNNSKQKMLEILKRFHGMDHEDDESDATISEETIQKMCFFGANLLSDT